ncbi:hypothetical protein K438DRAFT_1985620 [Mycena galopus ATCC 62051]|nr:hypothetical protein K438DRAFT_1985620 [Mycena galopus ATCC 62051]
MVSDAPLVCGIFGATSFGPAPAGLIPNTRWLAPRTPPTASVEAVWTSISIPPCRSVPCPLPRRRCRRARPLFRTAPGPMKDAPPPHATYDIHPHSVLLRHGGSVSAGCLAVLLCCSRTCQFELIVPPRLDRTSNDASIFTRARRCRVSTGLSRTPSSGAASSPCCLIPSQTAANTEYTFSNDAGSPLDWPSYRVHRPPVPPRLDLAPATRSHGGRAFLGSPRRVLCMVLRAIIASPSPKLYALPHSDSPTPALPASGLSLALPMRVLPLLPLRVRLLAPPQVSLCRARRLAFTPLRHQAA